jgi:hypothetical protein
LFFPFNQTLREKIWAWVEGSIENFLPVNDRDAKISKTFANFGFNRNNRCNFEGIAETILLRWQPASGPL